MVFYFTATGNCLYIAKQLDDHIVSIPQVLGDEPLRFRDEKIGVVAPIYAGKLPRIVMRFLEKVELETEYFYFVLTYGRTEAIACEWSMVFAENLGIHVCYANSVRMVNNWLPSFDMVEECAMDKKIPEQLAAIKADISNRKNWIKPSTEYDRKIFSIASKRNEGQAPHQKIFNLTEACTGCGLCTRVCPISNIRVENGRATFISASDCEICLACAHACPAKAIQAVFGEKNPDARYRNENIMLEEIIAANEQWK